MRLFVVVFVLIGLLIGACYLAATDRRPGLEDPTTPCEPVDPCDDCLRWPECNGVDTSCPLREEGTHGKE